MGSSRWFLNQNNFFYIFFIHYAPRGTTHNLNFLNTQNRPTLLFETISECDMGRGGYASDLCSVPGVIKVAEFIGIFITLLLHR